MATTGNSTDITTTDCVFSGGLGISIGRIGQYNGEYEPVQRLSIDNVTFDDTFHALRMTNLLPRRILVGSNMNYAW